MTSIIVTMNGGSDHVADLDDVIEFPGWRYGQSEDAGTDGPWPANLVGCVVA
ncbi:hypothetical protein [Streptomyces sp. NPDC002054]|uniref:hypothetical protein n=1 Tax=Streptomyces sp. NPDC002054 TaxID=3154663 RepID=UPI00331D380C